MNTIAFCNNSGGIEPITAQRLSCYLPQSTITEHTNRIRERCNNFSSLYRQPAQAERDVNTGLQMFLTELRHLQLIESQVMRFCKMVMIKKCGRSDVGFVLAIRVMIWLLDLKEGEYHIKKNTSQPSLIFDIAELRNVVAKANKTGVPSDAHLKIALAGIARSDRLANSGRSLTRPKQRQNNY